MLACVQSTLTRSLSPAWQIFALLLLFDLLLCWLHLLFAQSGSVLFHSDHEVNLPTTYQSFKLILFGGFFVYQLLRLYYLPVFFAAFFWIDYWFRFFQTTHR